MAYYDDEEKIYFNRQMNAILTLSLSLENRLEGRGTLSQRVADFQMTFAENKAHFRIVMETYEQELLDARMKNMKYEQRDPKHVIKLSRRSDLKNRRLIGQLRDLCKVRLILNHAAKSFGIQVDPLDDKFITHLRKVFDTHELLTSYSRATHGHQFTIISL